MSRRRRHPLLVLVDRLFKLAERAQAEVKRWNRGSHAAGFAQGRAAGLAEAAEMLEARLTHLEGDGG